MVADGTYSNPQSPRTSGKFCSGTRTPCLLLPIPNGSPLRIPGAAARLLVPSVHALLAGTVSSIDTSRVQRFELGVSQQLSARTSAHNMRTDSIYLRGKTSIDPDFYIESHMHSPHWDERIALVTPTLAFQMLLTHRTRCNRIHVSSPTCTDESGCARRRTTEYWVISGEI